MKLTLSFIFILLFPTLLIASTISVCDQCEVKTINEAVIIAQKADTIVVESGIYPAVDVQIDKSLILIGRKGAVLDGMGKRYILKINADSVTVRGFTFINSGKSYTKDYASVYVSKSHYFTLENNRIENPFFGYLIEKSHFGKVQNNVIFGQAIEEDDSGNGIHLWHCSHITVQDNEVYNLRDGIYFEFVSESKVMYNYSHHNVRYGLHFMFSNHDEYLGNTFLNNGSGVAVMFSKFIQMKNNKFMENWGLASYGLLLKEIYDAEIIGNKFSSNTIGIFVEGCTRVNYFKNDFADNGWAVKIAGACYTNRFVNNNFLYNAFDLSYNSKLNDNEFFRNHWSSYTGYDLDKNGIGDIAYRPVKLFSYVVNQTPESIILLRSLFIDIINFSEKVSPVFTPNNLLDSKPLMKVVK